jgi:hypothetical protein
MPSRNEPLEALIDALQVIAVLSTKLRQSTSESAEDAVQIEAAADRAITIVKRLREGKN